MAFTTALRAVSACRQNELLQHSNEALQSEKEAIAQETVCQRPSIELAKKCMDLCHRAWNEIHAWTIQVELALANKTRSGKVRSCNALMTFSWAEQVKLKAQQSMLQKRLQQALQMHLQPRTSVNTESPADRTLRLLDSLLQV